MARPWLRWLALAFTAAGLMAHSLYAAVHPLPLQTPFGSLIFLAWILAVFCVYGAIHHSRLAWELFVLPLVLGLVLLSQVFPEGTPTDPGETSWRLLAFEGRNFWHVLHGVLMLLAAVGVCVGFVASVMYLVQRRRLKTKQLPGQGLRLWSLERLESMNRRAIVLAFPLLTMSLLVALGSMLKMPESGQEMENWKVLSSIALWIVFAVLLSLRYGIHAGGRQVAWLTILAFALLLLALVTSHPFAQGGSP